MLHTIKQLGTKVISQSQTSSTPYFTAGYLSGSKVLPVVNQKQIQTTAITPNHCQQKRFFSISNSLNSNNMKRLQGKVAVVTASTDG